MKHKLQQHVHVTTIKKKNTNKKYKKSVNDNNNNCVCKLKCFTIQQQYAHITPRIYILMYVYSGTEVV